MRKNIVLVLFIALLLCGCVSGVRKDRIDKIVEEGRVYCLEQHPEYKHNYSTSVEGDTIIINCNLLIDNQWVDLRNVVSCDSGKCVVVEDGPIIQWREDEDEETFGYFYRCVMFSFGDDCNDSELTNESAKSWDCPYVDITKCINSGYDMSEWLQIP